MTVPLTHSRRTIRVAIVSFCTILAISCAAFWTIFHWAAEQKRAAIEHENAQVLEIFVNLLKNYGAARPNPARVIHIHYQSQGKDPDAIWPVIDTTPEQVASLERQLHAQKALAGNQFRDMPGERLVWWTPEQHPDLYELWTRNQSGWIGLSEAQGSIYFFHQ